MAKEKSVAMQAALAKDKVDRMRKENELRVEDAAFKGRERVRLFLEGLPADVLALVDKLDGKAPTE